jgi:regulatory protein
MNYTEALNRCKKMCSTKEYCIQDITDKLLEWEMPEETAAKIIQALVHEKYIDNNRFAEAFVHDKFHFNHWGRIKISFHLKQKKIDTDIIKKALYIIEEREYEKAIINEISKKRIIVIAKTDFERNGKIARSVIAKGFEPEKVFGLLKMDF